MKITRWTVLFLAFVLLLGIAAFASPEPSGEAVSGEASEDPLAPVVFPDDAKIVSAAVYSVYTKKPDSPQDAVMKVTLY